MKIHYIYKITNTKPTDKRLYYIGVRSTLKATPELDTNYKSSSDDLKAIFKEFSFNNFKKEILSTWATRKEANQEEIRLHNQFDVAKNDLFYNKAKSTSSGFCTEGYVTVVDTRDGKNKNVTQNDYKLYDHYVSTATNYVSAIDTRDGSNHLVQRKIFEENDYFIHVTVGRVAVRDIRDGSTTNVSQEDYEKYDYYQAFNIGRVNVIDTRDNKTKQVSKEEFEEFDYYISVNSNCATVKDMRDGKIKHVSSEDYKKYVYYVSTSTGSITVIDTRHGDIKRVSMEDYNSVDYYISGRGQKINIYNDKDELMFETWGNFKKICKDNKLPYNVLYQAQLKGGLTIPLNKSQKSLTRFNSDGFGAYLGWSARKVEA